MNFARVLLIGAFVTALPAFAVYAPIPQQDQGKALTFTFSVGASYDTNIFGAQTQEIESAVFSASPMVTFNGSLTDQTFAMASYKLTIDHFTERPGDKTLDSHQVMGRLAHAFTKVTTLDVTNVFMVQKNPESLLAGLPLNSDQSFKRNQLDARFATELNPKVSFTLKGRSVLFRYDNERLSSNLDRTENLVGVATDFAMLPELKLGVEYRRQTIDYRSAGDNKDKTSDFGLVGGEYAVAKKLTAAARFGFEYRRRERERSETEPYAEISGTWDYAKDSFLSAGYIYTFEETSNVTIYTDTQVNRFFANVQHTVTALVVASASLGYEPSQLQGRRGVRDVDETTTRLGLAVSYLPTKNWVIAASFDHDDVDSDDSAREMKRDRTGLFGSYTF